MLATITIHSLQAKLRTFLTNKTAFNFFRLKSMNQRSMRATFCALRSKFQFVITCDTQRIS